MRKRPIGRLSDAYGDLYLDGAFEPVFAATPVQCEEDFMLHFAFDLMWFAIPTSFRKGDIVRDAVQGGRPFVIAKLPSWGRVELAERGFAPNDDVLKWAEKVLLKRKQTGDMRRLHAYGFRWDEGRVEDCIVECNYLDLEYVGSSCEDKDRWAFPVSDYVKGSCRLDEAADRLCGEGFESVMSMLHKFYGSGSPAELYVNWVWKSVLHWEGREHV